MCNIYVSSVCGLKSPPQQKIIYALGDGYFFEAGLDRDCVSFLVEVDGGEPVGESKDPAEHSSLAGGDLVEEGRV
jgi:hypothetical protein